MQAADAAAPVPVDVLVRRAGWAVAAGAARLLRGTSASATSGFDDSHRVAGAGIYGARVVVVAGKGNNGADGRAAAAVLARRGAGVRVLDAASLPAGARLPVADLVIDAAYGTGFRGSYDPPDPGPATVLAVDVPSGLQGDTGAVAGDTLRAALDGHDGRARSRACCWAKAPTGPVRWRWPTSACPSARPAAHLVEDADRAWLPRRERAAHKWAAAVWVLAGSPGMRGAARLCTRAAQRAGAGMIHVGSPGLGAEDHPPGEAVAVGLPASGWDEAVVADLGRFHALALGPGLGRTDAVRSGVRRLLSSTAVAVVVDADGLFALGAAAEAAAVIGARPAGAGPVVLTPHDGEFARLAGAAAGEDRIAAVRQLASTTGAVVLLKGPTTVVADPGGAVLLAAAGDARLATAGTGDVLTGVIAAFLAVGLGGLRAAALASHVHGRAALLGPATGLVSGDLPDLLPSVLGVV